MWSDFVLTWSEVKWVMLKFLGIKVTCTLGWPYMEGIWLYCDYFIWWVSRTVVVLTFFIICGCVGFVMCGYFDSCVGVLLICVLVFIVFLYCFIYVYLLLFVNSVRLLPPSENSIAVNNNNNNSQGCKEQLIIDSVVLEQAHKSNRSLYISVYWLP